MHQPFMIPDSNYAAGQRFAVDIKYNWFGIPHKDYTLKVYSRQSIDVTDYKGNKNQLHADGKSPTEFTESAYCGMEPDCTPNTPYDGSISNGNGSEDLNGVTTSKTQAIEIERGTFTNWFQCNDDGDCDNNLGGGFKCSFLEYETTFDEEPDDSPAPRYCVRKNMCNTVIIFGDTSANIYCDDDDDGAKMLTL